MENLINVFGSSYDMGFQQGKFFKKDIKNTFKRILSFEGIKTLKPKFLPKFIFGEILKNKLVQEWEKPIEIIMPDLKERLIGISDGSNIDISELYVVQALEVLSDDVSLVSSSSCSCFAILPERSEEKQLIIGKNFDFINDFKNDNLIRISHPEKKYSSIELTYKQIAGCHDGMNQKGLTVIYNYGVSTEKTQVRLPITLLVQKILQECETIEEALIVVKNFRYPNGAILLIADSKNNVISVEITPEHIGLRYPEHGFIFNTNFYLSNEIKKYNIKKNTVYSSKAPKSIRGKRIHESNEIRYNRGVELIEKEKKISVEYLINLLKDHNGFTEGNDNTICRHGGFFSTQVSGLFYPNSRKVLICYGPPCKNEYRELGI